jgi:DNA-binding CsgD family transcriptional regulator
MLLGRRREQAAIDRMLERTRAGEGGGLVLRGEPGIGKSVLLSYAAERADGMRVLRAVGVEAESILAFATLYRLLRPVLDRAQELPEPQARALGVAFGLEAGEAPDRFLVSVATLTLLSEVAGERPVLCLVDDAHWADTPSAQALTFVARRLEAEPLALLVAIREGEGWDIDTAGMEELHLAGLDPDAAAAILDARWGALLAPADRGRLVRATGGNPLALLELPGALTGWPLAGRDPLHEPPRLAGELERAFLERARRRKPEVQTLLLLAAAEGSGYVETIRRAAERLRLDPGLLESPDLADLVQIDGPTVEFRHPLVRSAVYHGANPAARRKAHQALAEALDGEEAQADRRAWHRAQAAEGPDEEVACELERSAERTLRRSGHASAAVALQRAAEFSRSDEDRARRLTAAAGAAWRGGDTAGARALLDRSERLGVREAGVRLDIQYLRGTIELHTGVPADGLAILLQAAGEAVQVDPHRATRVLLAAAEAAFQADRADAVPEIGRLLGRLPPSGDPNDELLARLHLATKGTKVAEDSTTLLADLARVEELDDPDLLVRVGGMAWGLGDHALGRRLRTMAVTRARALGAAGTLAWALAYLAAGEMHRSRYASAEAYADEGRRLALETGRLNIACRHLATLAATAALRGQEQEARRLAEETLAEATARRLGQPATVARSALVTLALASGRAEEALAQLETLRTSGPIPGHQGIALHTVPDLVEAAVRAGQPERAREQLDGYLAWAAASSPEARAVAARSRALLASGDEADHLFQEALRLHAGSDRPLDHARTELLYGEFLRRERRRAEARPHLRTALEAFERLGTLAWAERARGELRVSGETPGKRGATTLDRLTPQQLQVVRAVSQGLTNREVAAQLFISPHTVDYHLRKVFRKLGISSRAELIRLALTGVGPGGQSCLSSTRKAP